MNFIFVSAENGTYFKILVFTKTVDQWPHASRYEESAALVELGAANNIGVVVTEDSSVFNDAYLAQFKAIFFCNTAGNNIIGPEQRLAIQRFIQKGNGWMGIHAASDPSKALIPWTWYYKMLGATFREHP